MTAEVANIAKLAIGTTLVRIKTEPQVQYWLGPGTETYARLTKAYAALTNQSVDELREQLIPGSAAIHREGKVS